MIPRKQDLMLYLRHRKQLDANGRLVDLSGRGHNADILGVQDYKINPYGDEVREFDGSTTMRTEIPDYPDLINWSTWEGISLVWYGKLEGRGVTSTDYQSLIQMAGSRFAIKEDGVTLFYLDGLRNWVTNDGAFNTHDGAEHLLVVTYDKVRMRFYVDGVLVSSIAQTGDMSDTSGIYSNRQLKGVGHTTMMYKSALTQTEIVELYKHLRTPLREHKEVSVKTNTDPTGLRLALTDGTKDYANNTVITRNNVVVGKEMVFKGNSTITTNLEFSAAENTLARTIVIYMSTTDTSWDGLFATGSTASSSKGFRFASPSANRVFALYSGVSGSFNTLNSLYPLSDGKIHQIVATWDGTDNDNSLKLYVDGTLHAQEAALRTYDADSSTALFGNVIGNEWFTGTIYKAEVYNRVWNSAEVDLDYRKFRQKNLMFHTNDGVKDLTGRYDITQLGVVGKEIVCDDADVPTGITVPIENEIFTGTDGFTISCVLKPFSLGGGSFGRFFDKTDGIAAVNGFHAFLSNLADGTTRINYRVASTVNSGNDVLVNAFNHMIMTTTQAGIVNFYINGKQSGAANLNTGTPVGAITTSNPLGIGRYVVDNSRNFDGIMRNVRIFNKVLNASERQKVYENDMRYI